MKFLFLEPFFGGSHKDFAQGLIKNSCHKIDLLTLPARFWKWRMRGAALYFIKKIKDITIYDGIITTDLMSLSDFKSLAGQSCPCALVYFHENQLTYPLSLGERMDFQYGFTDITTALAAQKVLFNSNTHFNAFISKLPEFIKMMPEFHPNWVVDEIKAKSQVLYPGCCFSSKPVSFKSLDNNIPLIIWNHRWEFDKGPEAFFKALNYASNQNVNFNIALLGENFTKIPKVFKSIFKCYEKQIIQYGYIKSKAEYYKMLNQGNIVISTAAQENYGISIIEAVRHGCIPLLPNRLSYPEILPSEFHKDFLYNSQQELNEKLLYLILNYTKFKDKQKQLSCAMEKFAWENLINKYDKILEHLGSINK